MYGTFDTGTGSEIANGDFVSVLSDADPEPGFKGKNCYKKIHFEKY